MSVGWPSQTHRLYDLVTLLDHLMELPKRCYFGVLQLLLLGVGICDAGPVCCHGFFSLNWQRGRISKGHRKQLTRIDGFSIKLPHKDIISVPQEEHCSKWWNEMAFHPRICFNQFLPFNVQDFQSPNLLFWDSCKHVWNLRLRWLFLLNGFYFADTNSYKTLGRLVGEADALIPYAYSRQFLSLSLRVEIREGGRVAD